MSSNTYYTTQDISEFYNVTTATVIRWCKIGLLRGAQKQGRDWIIPASALDGFVVPKSGRPWWKLKREE